MADFNVCVYQRERWTGGERRKGGKREGRREGRKGWGR